MERPVSNVVKYFWSIPELEVTTNDKIDFPEELIILNANSEPIGYVRIVLVKHGEMFSVSIDSNTCDNLWSSKAAEIVEVNREESDKSSIVTVPNGDEHYPCEKNRQSSNTMNYFDPFENELEAVEGSSDDEGQKFKFLFDFQRRLNLPLHCDKSFDDETFGHRKKSDNYYNEKYRERVSSGFPYTRPYKFNRKKVSMDYPLSYIEKEVGFPTDKKFLLNNERAEGENMNVQEAIDEEDNDQDGTRQESVNNIQNAQAVFDNSKGTETNAEQNSVFLNSEKISTKPAEKKYSIKSLDTKLAENFEKSHHVKNTAALLSQIESFVVNNNIPFDASPSLIVEKLTVGDTTIKDEYKTGDFSNNACVIYGNENIINAMKAYDQQQKLLEGQNSKYSIILEKLPIGNNMLTKILSAESKCPEGKDNLNILGGTGNTQGRDHPFVFVIQTDVRNFPYQYQNLHSMIFGLQIADGTRRAINKQSKPYLKLHKKREDFHSEGMSYTLSFHQGSKMGSGTYSQFHSDFHIIGPANKKYVDAKLKQLNDEQFEVKEIPLENKFSHLRTSLTSQGSSDDAGSKKANRILKFSLDKKNSFEKKGSDDSFDSDELNRPEESRMGATDTLKKPISDATNHYENGYLSLDGKRFAYKYDDLPANSVVSFCGYATRLSIIGEVNLNYTTNREKRTEIEHMCDTKKERTFHMSQVNNKYFYMWSNNLSKEPPQVKKYCTSLMKDVITESANLILLKKIALSPFIGKFKTKSLLMDGSCCENIYDVGVRKIREFRNDKLTIVKVTRTIKFANGSSNMANCILTSTGQLVKMWWNDSPYKLVIHPKYLTRSHNLFQVPLSHLYFEKEHVKNLIVKKTKKNVVAYKKYLRDNPEIINYFHRYLKNIMLKKPKNVLPFTLCYFSGHSCIINDDEN